MLLKQFYDETARKLAEIKQAQGLTDDEVNPQIPSVSVLDHWLNNSTPTQCAKDWIDFCMGH